MRIVADLHVHSRHSRATSRDSTIVELHRSALQKGIQLVGTGDFTHPGYFQELEEQLQPAEDGLFRLRPELQRAAEQGLPAACSGAVRFVLQVEISNIYKKADRTRKNHNLVFVPTFDAARTLCGKLARIGNLASDGRPILGLDARDLLEITLESDPQAFLIPAHIWTPWFSLFGSKSGFDSLQDCFGDLSEHIFAVETGLSSDPPMNWRVSALDCLTLVSNSDAHSPGKLAREANVLDIELSYGALLEALRTRRGWWGTLEFFPEEGKYHLDGHRKCNVRLDPEQTSRLAGRCPACGEPLTVGVLNRVVELADRPPGARPEGASQYASLVPLEEVAAQVCGVGPASKRTRELVSRLLERVGPELELLQRVPLEELQTVGGAVLAEAIRRTRSGELQIDAGYDGQYGTVRVFAPGERDHLVGQLAMYAPAVATECVRGAALHRPHLASPQTPATSERTQRKAAQSTSTVSRVDPLTGLDPEQSEVATSAAPLLVVAGPGAGKTRTLVARILHHIVTGQVRPEQVLAITFTNQAADELRQRIAAAAGAPEQSARVATFHAFGRGLLAEIAGQPPELTEEEQQLGLARLALGGASRAEGAAFLERVSLAKQALDPRSQLGALAEQFDRYQALLDEQGLCDIDDLVLKAYQSLASDPKLAHSVAARFRLLCVDEYQDVNDVQAALVKLLAPRGEGLCAIGDPDQAIYGFRGARPGHFARFAQVFPGARRISISTSYRLTEPVLRVARSVLPTARTLISREQGPVVEVVATPTPASEAEQIVVRLERLVGGTSHFAVDSGRGFESDGLEVGFGDVAVLTRTKAQHALLLEAFRRSGIPARSVGEEEPHDPRAQQVGVMTMHASKGREFDVVFVAGVERGLVPLELEGLRCDPAEEARLLYVALTRARQLLVLSHAQRRTLFGRALPAGRSPLLNRLPSGSVVQSRPTWGAPPPRQRQLSLFD